MTGEFPQEAAAARMRTNRWAHTSPLFSSLCKYLLVGGANTLLVWVSIFVFNRWAMLPSPLAVTCAYALSICFHFLTNRSFTFSSSGMLASEFLRYMLLFVVSYLLTMGVIYATVDVLGLPLALGMLAATVLTVPIGYLASYFWVFEVTR